ncbi:MFS family permease [Nocardioides aromaticivorans]|uniref:MFS family permease n=1 Tax=Nocardioides aromaticivorans TaxID=200618 RepID=A0A7Z0CN15_9ACTN|nr:MFS transporter [Nocardioides aromaticivorans]NYI44430.1 MFS family permease [Nocardioides aromaticivorans]
MSQTQQAAGTGRRTTRGREPGRATLVGIGSLLVVLTNAVIFILPPLLPVIQAQYGLATVAEVTWLYTVLTLGGGAGFILLPRLADLHGDRNANVAAAAFLTVGALVPAIGDSYPTLLVGCALMGFGGAAQVLPLGFLRRGLGESGITVAVAVLVIGTGVGIVAGMIGGGLIVQTLSLQSFFVVLTAIGAVTTVASYLLIPHLPPAERGGRIGVVGTVWMIAWVAAILLTLTQGLVWGNAALIPLVLGVVGGIAWFRVERRSSNAVFDVALMKAPLVTASCICITLFAAVNAAFLLLVSTYAQIIPAALRPVDAYGLGLSALDTGWLMLPFALTFVVGGAIADRPVNNGRVVPVFVSGALISAAGLAWLALAHDQQWHYLVGAAVIGLGCSIGYAAGFTLVQLAVPEEKAGMATGVAGTFLAVGFAFGTALVSADLSASLVPVPGTTLEVAAENLYGVGYWLAGALALAVVLTVLVSTNRSRRRTGGVVA